MVFWDPVYLMKMLVQFLAHKFSTNIKGREEGKGDGAQQPECADTM